MKHNKGLKANGHRAAPLARAFGDKEERVFVSLAILIGLMALPPLAFFVSRRLSPSHPGSIAGAALGMILFPVSHMLTCNFGRLVSVYRIISSPIQAMSPLESYTYSHQLIANGLAWGALLAVCGYLLDRLFFRNAEYNQFASVEEKLKGLGLQSVSLWSQEGLDAYERAKSKLEEDDEKMAEQLIVASHAKDRDKIKKIGEQLNKSGGIDKMKLLCYRARHLGGDDRWIEMMWSGIGDWQG
jgi:hypothetical protein